MYITNFSACCVVSDSRLCILWENPITILSFYDVFRWLHHLGDLLAFEVQIVTLVDDNELSPWLYFWSTLLDKGY